MSRSRIYDRPDGLTHVCAVIEQDERIATPLPSDGSPDGSDATQAGLTAAVEASFVPGSSRRRPVRLSAVGAPTADTVGLHVTRGGLPGAGMAVAMRPTPEAQWRGWSTPNVIDYVTPDEWDRGIDAPNVRSYAITPTADGALLAVWSDSAILGRRFDPTTQTRGATFTIADPTEDADSDAATYSGGAHAPLDALLLPSGRIVVYAVTSEIDGAQQVWAHYSDDHGATWRPMQAAALVQPVPLSDTVLRLSAAEDRGAVLLVLTVEWEDGQTTERGLLQYASHDWGHGFQLVDDYTDGGTPRAGLAAAIVDPGARVFVVVERDPVGGTLRARRLASPYTPLRTVAAVAIDSPFGADAVAWAAPEGPLWVSYGPTVGGALGLARSDDGGATWTILDSPPLAVDASRPIDRWEAAPVAGRVWWWVADSAGVRPAYRGLLCASGGWSALLQPRRHARQPVELSAWEVVYLPLALPSAYGWALGGSGGSIAVSAIAGQPWRCAVSTLPAQTMIVSRTLASSAGVVAQYQLQISAGGGTGAAYVGLRILDQDSGVEAEFEIRHDHNQLHLVDLVGGGVDSGSHPSARAHALVFRVSTAQRHVAVHRRAVDSEEWHLVAALTLTPRAGATATTIEWGHLSASSATSYWGAVLVCARGGQDYSWGTWEGAARDPLPYAPALLQGGPVPAPPLLLPVSPLLGVQATGGPVSRGDGFTVSPAYTYGAEQLTSRPRSRPWRSGPTSSAQRVAWDLGAPTLPAPGCYGLAILGANVRQLALQGWDGAAWVDLAELDLAAGRLALPFTRSGDWLTVDTAAAQLDPVPYLLAAEHDGHTVDLGGGALRTVAQTRAGAWTPTATGRAALRIEGYTGAEPASGTLDIWRRDGVAVIVGDSLTTYQRLALTVLGQATVAGYYEIARAVIGPATVLPHRWSRGMSVGLASAVELAASPAARAARRVGPTLRRWQVAWAEGHNAGAPYTGLDPGHLALLGYPVTAIGDASPVDALAEAHLGGLAPLVIVDDLAGAPEGEGGVLTAIGRQRCLYGSITAAEHSREIPVGEPGMPTEIARVGALVIEEEP